MKRLAVAVLVLIVLIGVGFGAYRLGLFNQSTASTTPGEAASVGATGDTAASSGATGGESGAVSPGTPGQTAAAGEEPAAPAGTPVPVGTVATAQMGQPIANKSIELRVTGHRTVSEIGGQSPGDGRQFVIVDSAWKSLVPPQKVNRKKASDRTAGMGGLGFGGGATAQDRAADEANTTIEEVPFAIGPMLNHVWLIADGKYAEPIAADATEGVDGHLPTDTLTIPGFQKVVSGGLAFEAPANAQALALMYLDSKNGHLLVPITGAAPTLVSSLGGTSRSNAFVDLAVTRASWSDSAEPGSKTLVATLRGISRQEALVDIPFGEFSFLQTGQGCIVEPETSSASPAVAQPLAPMGRFVPFVPREGQLAFTVPADTQSATLLLRLRGQAPIDLPLVGDGNLRMPPVRATHKDGNVLRVHVIGTGAPPDALPPPGDGLERLVVDYLVENLTAGAGAELQPEPQFALADDKGTKYEPAPESQQLPCRLTGANVVPAGGWRRFSLLYVVPAGQPLTLKYRGFESEGSLKVR